jgi:hypothetical protein
MRNGEDSCWGWSLVAGGWKLLIYCLSCCKKLAEGRSVESRKNKWLTIHHLGRRQSTIFLWSGPQPHHHLREVTVPVSILQPSSEGFLQLPVKSLYQAIGLWMIGSGELVSYALLPAEAIPNY